MGLKGYAYPSMVEGSRQKNNQGISFIVVRLAWEASGQPKNEYTAFMHLVGPGGDFVTGFDRPPADRGFATTYWERGDRFLTDFPLALPPDLPTGTYQVWTGLYQSDSQGRLRLPIIDADRPTRDDRIYLGNVELR
jgi:hypothetical protein